MRCYSIIFAGFIAFYIGGVKACGFKKVRILKAFNHTLAPDEEDEAVIYECRK